MSDTIPPIFHPSWHPYVEPLFRDERMLKLKHVILVRKPFYPIREHIFRVFSMPLENIKVVVLGQDPYPSGEAIGLAFAVKSTVEKPASLKVILGEIDREILEGTIKGKVEVASQWQTLQHWRNQGVFLLNTALTVERGKPSSHSEYWKFFTREILHLISTKVKPIWLLWGSGAQSFESYIGTRITMYSNTNISEASDTGLVDRNIVLKAPHPAAELYPNSHVKFTGCNHFHLTNEILIKKGLPPIEW